MPESLHSLALLACPIGMGAMMWMMMRGHRSEPSGNVAKEAELAALQAQIDQLHATQRDREQVGLGGSGTVRSWLVPVGIVAGSLILTYLCCLRPIRHGHLSSNGAKTSTDPCRIGSGAGADLDDAVNRARAELAHLTSELHRYP